MNELIEKMTNAVVFDMYHDDRYEDVKRTIENSRLIKGNQGIFKIQGTDFYIVSFKDIYSLANFNRLLGYIEAKYGELKVRKVA